VALLERDEPQRCVSREYAAFVARLPEDVIGITALEWFSTETCARLALLFAELMPHGDGAPAGDAVR
jgi:hypothetical protein